MDALFEQHKGAYPFDPTYGLRLPDLLKIQGPGVEKEPADFDAFWQSTFQMNERVPTRREERPSTFSHPGYRITELYFDTLGEWRVGGWLCVPERLADVEISVVAGHGYGGRTELDMTFLDGRSAVLFVCAPGFHLSVDPSRVVSNSSGHHVVTGIASPETYILRFCVAAFWSAARAMKELFPQAPILYRGWSFGGGIGTLMLPWQSLYVGAELGHPTFSNHPFRLENPTQGSASSVRELYQTKPEITATLDYYESVFAARRIRVPVVFGLSIFDPAVPAAGQFSVANAVRPELRTVNPFLFGHASTITHEHMEAEHKRHGAAVAALYAKAKRGVFLDGN